MLDGERYRAFIMRQACLDLWHAGGGIPANNKIRGPQETPSESGFKQASI
jgi:hypothetical protein